MEESLFIHIQSAKFPILPGEAAELVNEGTFGKALAQYLAEHLLSRGYTVTVTCCEDWGWWVGISGQPYALGCCVYGASDDPAGSGLCVKVSRNGERKWSFSKFRFIDTRERIKKLHLDLQEIFHSDPEVRIVGYSKDFPL